MTEQELRAYIEAIRPADEAAMDAARRRQAQLAKPPGSRVGGGYVHPAGRRDRAGLPRHGQVPRGGVRRRQWRGGGGRILYAAVGDIAAGGEYDLP